VLDVRPFDEPDRDAVIDLWKACDLVRSWNDPNRDIDRKMAHDPDGFLVGLIDNTIVAAAMVGYDGHRGSVYYLAVIPEHQRAGLGRTLMTEIEQRLGALGCPKLNVLVRTSNTATIGFYEHIGYTLGDGAMALGKRLIPDGPTP
jgi:ribosomal protein S18 acetylase RimI-like enzyme